MNSHGSTEIPTAYGTLEVETVECDSCGEDAVKRTAQRFVIGDEKENSLEKDGRTFTFERASVATGYACEHCQDSTLASFPDREPALYKKQLLSVKQSLIRVAIGGLLGFLTSMVMLSGSPSQEAIPLVMYL